MCVAPCHVYCNRTLECCGHIVFGWITNNGAPTLHVLPPLPVPPPQANVPAATEPHCRHRCSAQRFVTPHDANHTSARGTAETRSRRLLAPKTFSFQLLGSFGTPVLWSSCFRKALCSDNVALH